MSHATSPLTLASRSTVNKGVLVSISMGCRKGRRGTAYGYGKGRRGSDGGGGTDKSEEEEKGKKLGKRTEVRVGMSSWGW
jgi:hypothetical protein